MQTKIELKSGNLLNTYSKVFRALFSIGV